MSLFGEKNYDKEIKALIKNNNELVKVVDQSNKHLITNQEQLISFATIQAQHKVIISFLLKHSTIRADAEDDLRKMIQEINRIEKEVKELKEVKKK
ncbi:hypothetical protein M0R04_09870 [Candidatus Dojkabacteria bacterium]|jgi:hypothetical protein|nr:hypothetical protein [Candidatus Dojkabacteria bacterium]